MALDQLYQQVILDHNRSPHHFGRLPDATHSSRGQDASCGDDLLVELRMAEGYLEQAAFSGAGCAVTMASASMLMRWLPGRSANEIVEGYERFQQLLATPDQAEDPLLGEINHLRAVVHFPARVRNAMLPWNTAIRALRR